METRDYERARARLTRALLVDPSLHADGAMLSATIAFREGDWKAAAAEAARILELAPDSLYALRLHAGACERLARIEEAMQSARRSLSIERDGELHHWVLHRLNFLSETTPESLFEESCRWNALHAAPLSFPKRSPAYELSRSESAIEDRLCFAGSL